jgi:iron-sulfur cluster repair protein YtfE (RIC family)
MTRADLPLTASVNDVLRRAPLAGAVFNRYGIDTCCGGALTLAQAAESVGLEPADLVTALQPTLPPAIEGNERISTTPP